MEIKLEPQDLKNVSTFEPQASLGYLNMKIREKLAAQCREQGHIPIIKKVATIDDPRFDARQYGHVCRICNIRLNAVSFEELSSYHSDS